MTNGNIIVIYITVGFINLIFHTLQMNQFFLVSKYEGIARYKKQNKKNPTDVDTSKLPKTINPALINNLDL